MKKDIAIKVENVSKSFKLPHNKQSSLKGTLINLVSRGDRTYETQEVLRNVSFEIKKGEFFGIVGRNGSGKSTLLKMIAGIYEPTEGSITINGSLTPFIELGVGFNPELTGRENVYMNGALLGFNNKEVDEMYDDIVGFAELERFMDQKLKNYSSGMQVRLAFSIAIRARSDILVLDEVLAVGDAAFQQKCFDYFEMLKKQGQTVVLVTHDMSAVTRFCTNGIYIKDGDLVSAGSVQDITDLYVKDNIVSREDESDGADESGKKKDNGNWLTVELIKDTKDKAEFEFAYRSTFDDVFVGLSVQSGGVSCAELTTQGFMKLPKAGSVRYSLDKKLLNAGLYQMSAGLFRTSNRELLAAVEERASFGVLGQDIRRGAFLKLNDDWKKV